MTDFFLCNLITDLKHSNSRNAVLACNTLKSVKIIQNIKYYLQSEPVIYELSVKFFLFSKRATADRLP